MKFLIFLLMTTNYAFTGTDNVISESQAVKSEKSFRNGIEGRVIELCDRSSTGILKNCNSIGKKSFYTMAEVDQLEAAFLENVKHISTRTGLLTGGLTAIVSGVAIGVTGGLATPVVVLVLGTATVGYGGIGYSKGKYSEKILKSEFEGVSKDKAVSSESFVYFLRYLKKSFQDID
jgi:hypothetical protein